MTPKLLGSYSFFFCYKYRVPEWLSHIIDLFFSLFLSLSLTFLSSNLSVERKLSSLMAYLEFFFILYPSLSCENRLRNPLAGPQLLWWVRRQTCHQDRAQFLAWLCPLLASSQLIGLLFASVNSVLFPVLVLVFKFPLQILNYQEE